MSANWNCRESRLRMTWAVYSIYSQRLQENLLVSKNSTHLAVLIHLLPMLFIQCIYILTDCSLPQLTIFSLRLFLEYKKHLIFNLHWFLVIPASRRKFSSHKGATMYKYQLTQKISIDLIYVCLLKVLWRTPQLVAVGKSHHSNISEWYHLYEDIFKMTQGHQTIFVTVFGSQCSCWAYHELEKQALTNRYRSRKLTISIAVCKQA